MTRFAAQTTVSVERSRAEIESTVIRYGATAFRSGWAEGQAVIEFVCQERLIRFTLALPRRDDKAFVRSPGGKKVLGPEQRTKAWEQACRQRWRALALAIKAKLEAVESQISCFEDEFMAFVVDPVTGRTVGDTLRPAIADRYAGRPTLLGLPAPPPDHQEHGEARGGQSE